MGNMATFLNLKNWKGQELRRNIKIPGELFFDFYFRKFRTVSKKQEMEVLDFSIQLKEPFQPTHPPFARSNQHPDPQNIFALARGCDFSEMTSLRFHQGLSPLWSPKLLLVNLEDSRRHVVWKLWSCFVAGCQFRSK